MAADHSCVGAGRSTQGLPDREISGHGTNPRLKTYSRSIAQKSQRASGHPVAHLLLPLLMALSLILEDNPRDLRAAADIAWRTGFSDSI